MDKYAIVVAGGMGLRMGGDVPKQFIPIGGQPVLMRTIQAFCDYDSDIRIILVLPAGYQDYWKSLCEEYHFAMPHQIATGGETRFHSVQNGLSIVPDMPDGVVGVHDAARPFVDVEVIRNCYEVAAGQGTAVPVIPVVESVRQLLPEGEPQLDDGVSTNANQQESLAVDRSLYRLVQTPQAFRVSLLKEAYRQPYLPSFTDDASVVEELGYRIHLVEGNRENIKITTPSDLDYAEYLCLLKR